MKYLMVVLVALLMLVSEACIACETTTIILEGKILCCTRCADGVVYCA
jgi:hypothetical protein